MAISYNAGVFTLFSVETPDSLYAAEPSVISRLGVAPYSYDFNGSAIILSSGGVFLIGDSSVVNIAQISYSIDAMLESIKANTELLVALNL